MSKECKKKEKGITLTGLVITIIVLIILAGISLSYFIQEGIIDKAEEAGERMNQAAGEEAEGLKNLSNEIEGLISGVVIPEGAISIGEVEWEEGKASVQVSTNTKYEIEWQKEGEESWNKVANGGKIEGLEHGDIIFIRLTDGRNVGEESTVRVEDKTAPTVSISETGKTSSSITVQVEATDDETGMEENPTYTYYYKISGQPDSSYKQVSQGTSTTCTISGLTQGTKYTVKVEVADNAGNVGSGTVDITTATVTSGTVEGAITFSLATWSNGTARITISTNTSYTIEWQIGDAEEGNWTRGTSVTGLHHGDIVFARLTDGENVGQEATTKIEDKTAPTVSISETGKTSNSISVRAQATDKESGMASSPTYTYYYKISGQPDTTYKQANQGTSTTCTINGLTPGTKYTVKVEVTDNAGNVGSGTVDIIIPLPEGWNPDKVKDVVTEVVEEEELHAPIPDGFTASKVDGENTISSGLVIYETEEEVNSSNHDTALTTYNQYVWIPVKEINDMVMCKSKTTDTQCHICKLYNKTSQKFSSKIEQI